MHAGVNEFIWTRYLHGLWHDWLVAQPDPLPAIFDADGRYKSASVKYFQAVHRVLQGEIVFDDQDRLGYCRTIAGYIADPAMPECVVRWWQEAVAV